MTSSWFFLSTLNYDARSTTHQIYLTVYLFLDLFNDGNYVEPLLPELGEILFEFSN